MAERVKVIIYWDGTPDFQALVELGRLFYAMMKHCANVKILHSGLIQTAFELEVRDDHEMTRHEHEARLRRELQELKEDAKRVFVWVPRQP